jgi:hypothetical protein
MRVYPTSNGTLSWEGSAGQLFSITNSLSGTIFSVNDVSGIPSIEVLDTGLVKLAQYNGRVLVRTGTDNGTSSLQVGGGVQATSSTTGTLIVTGGVGVSGNMFVGGSFTTTSINNTPIGDVTPSTVRGTTVTATTQFSGPGTGLTGSGASFNAGTATNLSTNRTNWSTNGTISAVVGQLAWKSNANNHTIFDASASTSPDGTSVNNTNSATVWTATYPTLMGWNGSSTYGVRVDSARLSDNTSSISGAVGNTHTWTGVQNFQSNLGTTSGALSSPPLQVYSTSTNAAFMSFHRAGSYAVNMGLDSDNILRIGGWSAPANRLQMDMSGNLTMAGKITAGLPFWENGRTIAASVTLSSTLNTMTIGPVTINDGVSVTIPDGSSWSVV